MRDPHFDDISPWAQSRAAMPEEMERAYARAREVAAGPAEYARRINAIDGFRGQPTSCWRAFEAEFIGEIRRDPVRQRAWCEMLEKDVMQWKCAFPSSASRTGEEAVLRRAAEDWQRENDPFSVWTHASSHLEIHFRDDAGQALARLNLLVRIDPARGLRLVDGLPFPAMMGGVFYWGYDVREDRDMIEEFLVAAPAVFDDAGAWRPERSVAALLLTELIVGHAQKLQRAVAGKVRATGTLGFQEDANSDSQDLALRQVETTVLPDWMHRVWEVLLQRSDGRAIALGSLAHLVVREHGEPAQTAGHKIWSAFAHARDALCKALVLAGVTASDVRAAWLRAEGIATEKDGQSAACRTIRRRSRAKRSEREGEGARKLRGQGLPYLWGAVHMIGDEPRAKDDVLRLWSWLEELLEGRDPGLRLLERDHVTIETSRLLGFLLSCASVPSELFHRTYQRLESQRRRAQHPSRYGYKDHDLESTLLLRIGLHASERWHKRVTQTEEVLQVQDFFLAINSLARRLWLTTSHHLFSEVKKDLVALCFAFMPAIFDPLAPVLAKTIPPIANNPRMLGEACWFLWRNGVEARALTLLIREAGGDLEEALRDLNQWADLVAVKTAAREREFPVHLHQLAEALELSFAEDERTS